MNRRVYLAGLAAAVAALPGCASIATNDRKATTRPGQHTAESPPELQIEAEDEAVVRVSIATSESGAALLNETYALRIEESVSFDDVLTNETRYDVVVAVRNGETWERTLTPSRKYIVYITSDGEVHVTL